MNDAVNLPAHVVAELAHLPTQLVFLAPGENQALTELTQAHSSLDFWQQMFSAIENLPLTGYADQESFASLTKLFAEYQHKLFRSNNRLLLHAANRFLPIHPFGQTLVQLIDLGITLRIALLGNIEMVDSQPADIALHSSSLAFILRHEFGFDTLFVNGCFEEMTSGGFERFAKCFAIGNLNASGIYIRWSALGRRDIIQMMLTKLETIRKNLRSKNSDTSS